MSPNEPTTPLKGTGSPGDLAPSESKDPQQTNTPRGGTTQSPDAEEACGDRLTGTVAQLTGDMARAQALSTPHDMPGKEPTEGQSESARIRSVRLSQNVPGYKLIEKLGEGTFGVVFRAREEKTGIEVAIKFFAHGTDSQWLLLQAEVKQLANLQADPGIVQLKDVIIDAAPPFYVMALAERGCLARMLRQRSTLTVEQALPIFRQVVETMAYVHAKGIRHCDLKPGNVLLDARGRARIADFGQAHLSSDATPALGTFFYMAPEQADLLNQIPDTRWDVYSLGALFHSMVTGHPPRQSPGIRDELANTAELSHRLKRYREWVKKAPPTEHRKVSGMDRELADIIDRCLEINPEKRLRDAGAILDALAQREWKKKQKPLIAYGFIAPLLLVVAMGSFAWWMANIVVGDANNSLVTLRLQANEHLAPLAGEKVANRLEERLSRLTKDAGERVLIDAVRSGSPNDMRAKLQWLGERRKNEEYLLRWTVIDHRGTALANYPHEPSVIGVNYSWRDWFNGIGDQPDQQKKQHKPKGQPHISQPYTGTAKGQKFSVGLSAPIGDGGELIGVLLLTVDLEKLGVALKEDIGVGEYGFVALLNDRRHFLLHDNVGQPDKYGLAPRWDNVPIFAELNVNPQARKLSGYMDPVDRKEYLVGFAPVTVEGKEWWALVQHETRKVLEPIEDLRKKMTGIAVVSLVAVGVLMSCLWGWLIRQWRRKERLSHA